MGLSDMLSNGVETATVDTVQPIPGLETSVDSPAPAAPSAQDEAPLDSAAVERMAFAPVEKPVEQGIQAPQETEQVTQPNEETQKDENYGRGANKRIRELVAERNEERVTRERAQAEFQKQMQQMQMQIAQQQAEYQRHQMDLENRRLQMLEEEKRAREEAGLSEVEKARRKFLSDAQKEALQGIAPEIDALKQELQQERQWRDELTKRATARAKFARIDAMGKEVLEKDLLAGYAPDDAAALKEPMEELLHAFAGAYKQYPNQIAPQFKQFLQKWYAAESRKLSKTAGAKIAQSQTVPQPLPAAKAGAGASQTQWPSLADLKANGIASHPEWIRAGYPKLAKKAG
jgi:hypothetical protein